MNTTVRQLIIHIRSQKEVAQLYFTVTKNLFGFTTRGQGGDTMGDVKAMIEAKIGNKKVMIFSKSYCPFCVKAKGVFEKNYLSTGILSRDDYEVMEFENDPNCDEIQEYLKNKTGARSVPRVFVNGKCIGGGDETVQYHSQNKLKALLQ